MSKALNISIVGSTGAVGAELVQFLSEIDLDIAELHLFASAESVGEYYQFAEQELVVKEYDSSIAKESDVVFFATPANVTRDFIEELLSSDAYIIDLSGACIDDPTSVLCVPEVNVKSLEAGARLCSCPRPFSVALSRVFAVISKLADISSVNVTSLHSVAGAGKQGLDELWEQTRGVFSQQAGEQEAFVHQVAFNTIPLVDVILEDGRTKEEALLELELRALLGLPSLSVESTAVRVPVFHGDAAVVTLTTDKSLDIDQLIANFGDSDKLVLHEHVEDSPMPVDVAGSDEIHLGRLRKSVSQKNTLMFWVVFDGIRAATVANGISVLLSLKNMDLV